MATDDTQEPEALIVEELCRAVALRSHDVGWAAYLLGREVAKGEQPAAEQAEGEAMSEPGFAAAFRQRSQESRGFSPRRLSYPLTLPRTAGWSR
jgi:hypothetical protein